MAEMIRVPPSGLTKLSLVEFPLKEFPCIWSPERTVLRLEDGKRVPLFVWLHTKRKVNGPINFYDPNSLSNDRLTVISIALRRLSDYFRRQTTGPKTIYSVVSSFANFLTWIDSEEHNGFFERIFSAPTLAVEAFKLYHRYLKRQIQSNALSRRSAWNKEDSVLKVLSAFHERNFSNEVEKVRAENSRSTAAPKPEDVAQFMSTLTAIFDSACRVLESCVGDRNDGTWQVSISSLDESHVVDLPLGYSRPRLMELAAMAYAGLIIGDSGANLAQIQRFEEPLDLLEQLNEPDRISLTKKVVKLRAGGKAVPVTMTAVTFTRLRRFAKIRDQLIELLDCDDIVPFLFKCEYAWVQRDANIARSRIEAMEPRAILPISDNFPIELRKKIAAAGAKLPTVTLRQLRAYKQQHHVRHDGLSVAASTMGHTIATAVKSYCAAVDGVQATEIGNFMSSLHQTVRHIRSKSNSSVSIPAGSCASHGNPEPSSPTPVVQPDCVQTEGCFFCENYHIHADEEDLRKLLSCKQVLIKVAHLQGESEQADRAYGKILEHIGLLLRELRQNLGDSVYESLSAEIAEGKLSRYWAVKAQQLGLLGLIVTEKSS